MELKDVVHRSEDELMDPSRQRCKEECDENMAIGGRKAISSRLRSSTVVFTSIMQKWGRRDGEDATTGRTRVGC
jgi:hypothetical protein